MAVQTDQMRVIVAAERPDVRQFLTGIAEQTDTAVVVGQAWDATMAVGLARQVKPDIALVDCYLPHVAGPTSAPLSRVSGLDAAMIMSQEMPETAVVLLNNLDEGVLADRGMSSLSPAILTREGPEAAVPLELRDLRRSNGGNGNIIFARVQTKPWRITGATRSSFSEKALFIGGSGLFAGWCMILTMFLAPVGIFLAAIGAVTMLAGLGSRLLSSRRRRTGRKMTLVRNA